MSSISTIFQKYLFTRLFAMKTFLASLLFKIQVLLYSSFSPNQCLMSALRWGKRGSFDAFTRCRNDLCKVCWAGVLVTLMSSNWLVIIGWLGAEFLPLITFFMAASAANVNARENLIECHSNMWITCQISC